MWIISLDACKGYHQIVVNQLDKDNIALFSPNDKNYYLNFMPFGPTNAPLIYTVTMK